jgi:hypothetical protein
MMALTQQGLLVDYQSWGLGDVVKRLTRHRDPETAAAAEHLLSAIDNGTEVSYPFLDVSLVALFFHGEYGAFQDCSWVDICTHGLAVVHFHSWPAPAAVFSLRSCMRVFVGFIFRMSWLGGYVYHPPVYFLCTAVFYRYSVYTCSIYIHIYIYICLHIPF